MSWVSYKPDSDVSNSGWSSSPLWSKVDDDPTDSASESDSISANNTSQECVLGLPTISPDTYLGWKIRVRVRNSQSDGRQLSVGLDKKSDPGGTPIANTFSHPLGHVDTTYGYYEYRVGFWGGIDVSDISLDDYAIVLRSGSVAGTIHVAAVELLIPDIETGTPFGTPPNWTDAVLLDNGRMGPFPVGTSIRAVAHDTAKEVAWLYEATNPSDGHNNAEWSATYPISAYHLGSTSDSRWGDKNTELALASILGLGVQQSAADRIVAFGFHDSISSLIERNFLVLNDGGSTRLIETVSESEPDIAGGKDAVRVAERASEAYRAAWEDTNGIRTLGFDGDRGEFEGVSSDPQQLIDAIGVNGRVHVLYLHVDSGTGPARHRTVTATGMGSESGDITTGVAKTGVGAAYNDGANWQVAFPLIKADGSGIEAAVFQSADTPTISTEIVTTRDAFDAGDRQAAVMIANGTTLWCFWLDYEATANPVIRAASRPDGGSWSDEGAVASAAARTTLHVELVGVDTAGILTANGSGDIEYYEFDLTPAEVAIVKVEGESVEVSESDLTTKGVALTKIEGESTQVSESGLKVVEIASTGHTGWGIPIGIP